MANWFRHGWPGGQRKADDRLVTGETEGASVLAIIVLQQIHIRSWNPPAHVANIYILQELMDTFLASRMDIVWNRGIINAIQYKHGNVYWPNCSASVNAAAAFAVSVSGENATLVAWQVPLGPFSRGLLDVSQVRAVTEEIPKSRNAQGGGLHTAALRGQEVNVV